MQNENCVNQKEMVNHPKHYCKGKYECIDVMVDLFGIEEVKNWCKITAFKYLWRLGEKDDVIQEAKKCNWYLNKFIELENQSRKTLSNNIQEYTPLITQEEINMILNNNE